MSYPRLVACEITLIILQYEAFYEPVTTIMKVADVCFMLVAAKALSYFKTQSKFDHVITALCLLRVIIQTTLFLFQQKGDYQISILLNLIFLLYEKNVPQLNKLPQLTHLFLVALIFNQKPWADPIPIIVGNSLLIILVLFSFKSYSLKYTPPASKKSADFDIQIAALPQRDPDMSYHASPIQIGGISPLKENSKSMEALLLDDYAWIKGQQFIVLDEYENVVVQTFNVGNFSRSSYSGSFENDSLSQIMQLGIVSGNKDFQELLISSQMITQNKFTLKDLIVKTLSDFELYKHSLFVINRVDSVYMQDWMIKVFLISKSRRVFVFIQIEQKDVAGQTQSNTGSILTQQITGSLNVIMTLSALSEYDRFVGDQVLEKYFYPIRIASVQIYLQLANLRDYNLHHQKKFLLKVHQIHLQSALEELSLFFQDSSRARGNEIRISIDEVETLESDAERLKQTLYPLLKFLIKESKEEIIHLNVKSVGGKNYLCTMSTHLPIDDREVRKLRLEIKKANFQYSEISVSQILAIYLSGTLKKGIEIQSSEESGTQIVLYIQSPEGIIEDTKNIKLIGQGHYQETSLSQMLQHQESKAPGEMTLFREGTFQHSQDYSLHFSQSRISKQMSQKYSEYQSNYLSQVSRLKADSVNQKLNAPSFEHLSVQNMQDEEQKRRESKYQLPHFPEEPNDGVRGREQTFQNQPTSMIDFGSDVLGETIHVPVTHQAKMQSQIIKFSAFGSCCGRILVADSEFQNMQILEIILSTFKLTATRAFSTEEVLKQVNNRQKCKCGNTGFVLYFISVALPKKGGLWLCRHLKERMASDLQKGYVIATTGLVEYYSKMEYYRNGIDQYISLPYDLREVNQILRFLKC